MPTVGARTPVHRATETVKVPVSIPLSPTPPTPVAIPTPKAGPSVITYTVQAGDTLAEIAAEFGVTVEEMVKVNAIEDANLIEVGQVLVVPQH